MQFYMRGSGHVSFTFTSFKRLYSTQNLGEPSGLGTITTEKDHSD